MSTPLFSMADRFALSVSSIAASMFWTCPGLAVVSMAEIPRLRRKHRLIAFRADRHDTGVYGGLPPRSLPAVRCAISTLAGRAAPALIGVGVSLAEARPLRDKLWAIAPGASAKTHGRHLQPLVAGGASGMSGVRLPRRPPAGHPRFMGYRHNGCRRHGRRPSVRRLQGLLVAPCRTATIISIGKRKAPDPSGMVQVLLQITWTHPLAQVACRPARLD